jgi:hypothetical protein
MTSFKVGDYAIVCKPIRYIDEAEGSFVKVTTISTADIRYTIYAEYVYTATKGDFSPDELQLVTKETHPEYFV